MRLRSNQKNSSALAVGVLLLLGFAGCGGSDETTSTAAPAQPRLTKAQFVEQMNAVCHKNSEDQQRMFYAFKRKRGYSAGAVPPIPVQEIYIRRIVLPTVRRTIPELEALRPPKSQEARMEAFVRALDRATDISEKTPRWLAEPSKDYEPYMPARLLAAKIGTYLCGQA
jgi:hypothetical protein